MNLIKKFLSIKILLYLTLYINTTREGAIREENFNKLLLDITKDCDDGYSTSIRLSYGSGASDARVIILRSLMNLTRNCSIVVIAATGDKDCQEKECSIVAVVEFFNYKLDKVFCKAAMNAVFKLGNHDLMSNVCQELKNISLPYHIHGYLIRKQDILIDLAFENFDGTIKITVTAAKYLGGYGQCERATEIRCLISNKKICISQRLSCDGNFNCGRINYYDEYCMKQIDHSRLMYVVLYGLLLITVFVIFFIQILRVCIPAVAEYFFIFNEGEENKFVIEPQSRPPLELERTAEKRIEMVDI